MLAPPIPLRFLYLFPLVASTSWFLTLFILLVTWLAKGRPRYPLQSNPYVAFVSDIGAFTLKPLFCLGGILTAIFFTLTISSVHYARYSPKLYALPGNKAVSLLAIVASVASGAALVALSVLDTYRYHERHSVLLKVCFGGLGISAVATSWVYADQTARASHFGRLRVYCLISTAIVFVEVCLGAAFMILLGKEYWRVAGILEWIVCFIGAAWLGTFVGFVKVPDEGVDVRERDPLLGEAAYVH